MVAHDTAVTDGSHDLSIPKTYKAAVYDAPGSNSIKMVELDMPEPGPGEVLINLSATPHAWLMQMMNTWKMMPSPTQPGQVGGHEGVGKVVKLGSAAQYGTVQLGDRVGVKWVSGACLSCATCLQGVEGCCANQKVSGYYTPGTFQQYVLAPSNYVTKIPDGLDSAAAAPMLCAGVTTYAALRKSDAQSGGWVVISGAGGGLGHIACQLASRGMGIRVIGIDHGSKEKLVRDSGAEAFLDVATLDGPMMAAEVMKITGGIGASAVLVCTASNQAYAQALDFLGVGGTLPEGEPLPIATSFPAALMRKQLTINAVSVGNRKDAIEAMDFAARGVVNPHVRLEKLENLTEVFREMDEGQLLGRVVLDLQ
ncbi:MAG: hypothetical protein M1838_003146 [Thelocarpon superellum]|nr:MAG: hypothetical protein M1838_003146 [Thelocarpon superellum]